MIITLEIGAIMSFAFSSDVHEVHIGKEIYSISINFRSKMNTRFFIKNITFTE